MSTTLRRCAIAVVSLAWALTGCPSSETSEPAGDLGPPADPGPVDTGTPPVSGPLLSVTLAGSSSFDWRTDEVVFRPQLPGSPADKALTIDNVSLAGGEPLRLSSIGWATDAGGAEQVNSHIEFETMGWTPPWSVDVGQAAALKVTYTPPLEVQTDFRDSILVIGSDAVDETGAPLPEVTITIAVPVLEPVPMVVPYDGKFKAATPTQPERIEFRVENHPIDGTAPFAIDSVALTEPSNVFQVLNAPSPGHTVLASFDPAYLASVATFDVVYTPAGADTEDDTGTVRLTYDGDQFVDVELSVDIQLGSYGISYEHQDELDFSASTGDDCRRAILTSDGVGPVVGRRSPSWPSRPPRSSCGSRPTSRPPPLAPAMWSSTTSATARWCSPS